MLVVPIIGCDPPDLTINVSGSGSTTGAGIYNEDTEATISATPDPGWTFVNWTGDAVADPNSATTTITMDHDKTVTANFIPVTTNNLTINIIGEGSTTGAGTYNEGTVVTIVATPASEWTFDGWTGDVANPDSSNTTVTMDGNKTVTANFVHPVTTYDLTIYIIGEGSTTGAGTYNAGTVVTITATPDYGYVFDFWTGDVVANPNSSTTTVTMDGDKTVTANFFYLC